ncbi:hypothetical protein Tco_0927355 [Tanacetum coccineum]
MISNEYAVKLCLEHEVKRGNKVVKKELIVALRGEIYFVKFINNPEEDDVEPGILKKKKKSIDDWDQLLDFTLDDIPLLGGEELPPFVCKMGKSNRNKKRAMENLNLWNDCERRGRSNKKVKGEALKEKDDPGALIFPIRLEGQVNENASDVLRTAESDSDDEEEYEIKRNKFGELMYGLKPAPYLNCNDLVERSLVLQAVTNPFRKISVWKKAVSFLVMHIPKFTTSSCYGKVATEMLSLELCHEFYSTYEFDEVCVDDELQTKKIIKFRLGSRAHSLTLLEFSRRLGLYHADELDEEGFDVYILSGRYQGVLEHMVGVYSVPLQGAYNPPGYAQSQYDQYYQQYPPSPPQYPSQYQQEQDDDD